MTAISRLRAPWAVGRGRYDWVPTWVSLQLEQVWKHK